MFNKNFFFDLENDSTYSLLYLLCLVVVNRLTFNEISKNIIFYVEHLVYQELNRL